MLQFIAVVCCSVLKGVYCSVVQRVAIWCGVLQCGSVGGRNWFFAAFATGKLLQYVSVCCNSALQCVAAGAGKLLLSAFDADSVLQCVAAVCCGRVLQCEAVYCSELQ